MKKIFAIFLTFATFFLANGQDFGGVTPPKPGTIEFVVNTDRIIKNRNYSEFINNIVPFVRYNSDKIDSIYFIGSASPEGNKNHNIYLANIRADKIYSFISDYVQKDKVVVNNDYELFLEKTGLNEDDYSKLRAAYIEIHLKPEVENIVHDTVYVKEVLRDTLYICRKCVDTMYIEKEPTVIPILGIKTNLAADALITPNVQAELYTHLWGVSLEFAYTFPWYKIHDKFFYYQILNGTAGVRKYIKNDYTGHYFGVYGNTAIYDMCFFNKDKGWQGEAHGAGLTYGYVFQTKKHPRLKFECYVRVGWLNTRFDSYHTLTEFDDKYYYDWYGRASEFVPRRFNMNYYGPTEVGFNITYDLICLRKY